MRMRQSRCCRGEDEEKGWDAVEHTRASERKGTRGWGRMGRVGGASDWSL